MKATHFGLTVRSPLRTVLVSLGSLALLLPGAVEITSSVPPVISVVGPIGSNLAHPAGTSLEIRKLANNQPSGSKVAVGELSDGRLQVFEITAPGGLRSRW